MDLALPRYERICDRIPGSKFELAYRPQSQPHLFLTVAEPNDTEVRYEPPYRVWDRWQIAKAVKALRFS